MANPSAARRRTPDRYSSTYHFYLFLQHAIAPTISWSLHYSHNSQRIWFCSFSSLCKLQLSAACRLQLLCYIHILLHSHYTYTHKEPLSFGTVYPLYPDCPTSSLLASNIHSAPVPATTAILNDAIQTPCFLFCLALLVLVIRLIAVPGTLLLSLQ